MQWHSEVFRITKICIDSYENKVVQGRLYNPSLDDGIEFHGIIEFLKSVEYLLDEMNFPQSFSERRSFAQAKDRKHPELIANENMVGELGTFVLRVLFRQNASWQGSLVWCEGRSEECFRSVLELLFLIDSAIDREASQLAAGSNNA